VTSHTPPRVLIAGNWKMNGLVASLGEAEAIAAGARAAMARGVEVALFPPATLLSAMSRALAGSGVVTGGQDCHAKPLGAHTGDVSAAMLADAGATSVILGHSERRADHGEADALIAAKALAATQAGLSVIICVGETLAQRDGGRAESVVLGQLRGSIPAGLPPETLVVAYEPVWAIGTGRTASPADAGAMHAAIRAALVERFGAAGRGVRILYGGSVKPDNAAELLATPEIDGALVGGASLKAADFLAIVEAAPRR
jgi:triosephosphate isomerase